MEGVENTHAAFAKQAQVFGAAGISPQTHVLGDTELAQKLDQANGFPRQQPKEDQASAPPGDEGEQYGRSRSHSPGARAKPYNGRSSREGKTMAPYNPELLEFLY